MGKKIMLVATLVGVLSLGACVDDKESASVEKIRNAKAEQLLSIAELNKADAYAIKVLADADAALKATEAKLKEAEAKLKEAEAEKVKAEVEYQNARTEEQKAIAEKAKAEAEKAKFEAQQEEAELAVELAGQAEKLEAALWWAKAALLKAKGIYESALTKADEAEKVRLSALLTAYTDAANDLIDAKNKLASLKRWLVKLEYDLVDAEEAKEEEIIENEIQIAINETQKALYEKYYTVDPAEAKIAYEAANLEYITLYEKADSTKNERDKTYTERNEVNDWLYNSAYYRTLYYDVINASSYSEIEVYPSIPPMKVYFKNIDNDYYYVYDVTDTYEITTQVPLFTERKTKTTYVKYNFDDQSYGGTASYSTIENFFEVQTAGFNAYIAAYEEYIADDETGGRYLAAAKKAYEDAVKAEAEAKTAADETAADAETAKKAKEAADKAKTAADKAKTAADNAKTTADNALADAIAEFNTVNSNPSADADEIAAAAAAVTVAQTAVNSAAAAVTVAQTAANKAAADAADAATAAVNAAADAADALLVYQNANKATGTAKDKLQGATNVLDREKEKLAKVKEAYAFVTSKEQKDVVAANVKVYNDLSKKACDLSIQYSKESYAVSLKQAEAAALEIIYKNVDKIASKISECENQIKTLERQIADLRLIETKEGFIEVVKVKIENQEAKIVKLQKDYDTAKAAFEAATEAAAGE